MLINVMLIKKTCSKYRKLKKNPVRYHAFSKRQLFLLFVVDAAMKIKRYLKKENQLRY